MFEESVAMRLRMFDRGAKDARAAQALAAALERLGLAAKAMGDAERARGAWEEELLLADHVFADARSIEALRFRAIVEAHLAGVSGAGAERHRVSALKQFDELARAGALTEREAALRKRLWGA
jgi:hypothetical protein